MELKTSPPRRLDRNCPRRNLPAAVSRKRGETNFVVAFARAYEQEMIRKDNGRDYFYSREVPVTGFGIADFVCLTSKQFLARAVTTAGSYTDPKMIVRSFEMKLAGWQRGFAQACRYRFFSHSAFLVLPPEEASLAKRRMDLFRQTEVGLISFDPTTGKIRRLFAPRDSEPRSARAYKQALGRLSVSMFFKRSAENC
jgi:hypothetical protein